MLNHIILSGRLVKGPELRMTQNQKAVTSFTIACERDHGDKQTDFIDCVAWLHTAEFVSKYMHKGQLVIVSGRLQSRKWEDRDNNKRTSWEVLADKVYFAESKRSEAPTFTEEDDDKDGELPF